VGELFHAANLLVGHLLDLFERALLLVFADFLVPGQLLLGLVAVAADAAPDLSVAGTGQHPKNHGLC
jgi:hypothetical protein